MSQISYNPEVVQTCISVLGVIETDFGLLDECLASLASKAPVISTGDVATVVSGYHNQLVLQSAALKALITKTRYLLEHANTYFVVTDKDLAKKFKVV